MTLRIGELFAGYGGLGMGVQAAIGGELAWYSDVCKFNKDGSVGHHEPHRGKCAIMAHHHPDVPNLGDITRVDWTQVEPVDILTGGSPCQDLSHAGKRAGMTEGTRSNLWVSMREAIATLRPSLVVWENVRGASSAEADSSLEHCEGCMGSPGDQGTVLRALGRVLGDLSDLGYMGGWHGLRAADVGAPHGRFRVFVVAYPAGNQGRFPYGDGGPTRDAQSQQLWHGPLAEAHRSGEDQGQARAAGRQPLLPTPRATDGSKGGPNQRGSSGDLMLPSAVHLLGTPRASEWKGSGPVGSKSHAHMTDREYLSAQVLSLLPTPVALDSNGVSKAQANRKTPPLGIEVTSPTWGDYAPAIARWEQTLGRPAPAPTMTSSKGNPQLSPHFVEWMMGLPEGHVTGVPGLTRNEMLKALGDGVVPQQATAALQYLATVLQANED